MNSTRTFGWFLALSLSLVMGPGVASAQNVVLYELTEDMNYERLRMETKDQHSSYVTYRRASASLAGTAADRGPVCPDIVASMAPGRKCFVNATATDSFDVKTAKGKVTGTFTVVVQGDNSVDAPEQVVLTGTLDGSVDLSPAVLGPDRVPGTGDEQPLGSIRGTWSATGVAGGMLDGVSSGGTFTGTFRMPFTLPGYPPMYLTAAGPVPLQPNEFAVGFPTVRLELNVVGGTATTSGSWSGNSTNSYSGSSRPGSTSSRYSGSGSSGSYSGRSRSWSDGWSGGCNSCGGPRSGGGDRRSER